MTVLLVASCGTTALLLWLLWGMLIRDLPAISTFCIVVVCDIDFRIWWDRNDVALLASASFTPEYSVFSILIPVTPIWLYSGCSMVSCAICAAESAELSGRVSWLCTFFKTCSERTSECIDNFLLSSLISPGLKWLLSVPSTWFLPVLALIKLSVC